MQIITELVRGKTSSILRLTETYYQVQRIKTTKDIIKVAWKKPIKLVLDDAHLMWALILGPQTSAFSLGLAS